MNEETHAAAEVNMQHGTIQVQGTIFSSSFIPLTP
jgi:hypothetical protein